MKTVTATEAKNRLGAFLRAVSRGEGAVAIENHGKPTAVLISHDDYRDYREAYDRQRRMQAMAELRQLRHGLRARNQDLTEEEADAIAEELSTDAITSVLERNRRLREQSA
jgi:prevent-host-death family protein